MLALTQALENLGDEIRDAGVVVERGPMPAVDADHTELVRLSQNLVANSVKFRRDEPPRVRIHGSSDGTTATFRVSDIGIGIGIGIGIRPEDAGRLFGLFQRRHSRSRFPGTGIGLASCEPGVDQEQRAGKRAERERPAQRIDVLAQHRVVGVPPARRTCAIGRHCNAIEAAIRHGTAR